MIAEFLGCAVSAFESIKVCMYVPIYLYRKNLIPSDSVFVVRVWTRSLELMGMCTNHAYRVSTSHLRQAQVCKKNTSMYLFFIF